MRNIIISSIFVLMVFVFGCNDKAPACSTLSWGETKVGEPGFDLKYSAGNQCGNISDYYDVSGKDIDSYTSVFVGKMFNLNDVCFDSDLENEIECPDFIPESFKFEEMTGCKFTAPPDSNTDCPINAPVNLYFSCSGLLDSICIVGFLSGDDISGKYADSFLSEKDGIVFIIKRSSEKEYVATVNWETETAEGDKKEKTMILKYLAE